MYPIKFENSYYDDVINFDLKSQRLVKNYIDFLGYKYTTLCKREYFTIDKYIISTIIKMDSNIN